MNTLSPEQNRERLARRITELAAHIHAATYQLLCLIREFDSASGWEGFGMLSCAHWLNWRCGLSLGAAREKVRVAHALVGLPQISAAFEQGTLSYSKVRAMTRVATPENESELMNIALHGAAAHIEKLVRCYRRIRDGQSLERAAAQHQARGLYYYHDDAGSLVITARFTPEQGAVVLKAIQASLDAFEADAAGDNLDKDIGENLNPAGRQPSTAELDVTAGMSRVIPEPRESPSQRRADAWVRLAEAASTAKCIPASAPERYQVVVHIPQPSPDTHQDMACTLDDNPTIALDTALRLACDASVIHISEDRDGNPLHVGRKTRSISPALRRALKHRDGGCRFPGCTHTRFVHAHHVEHWADGGQTNIENLVTLCGRHHRLVHEGGFGLETGPGGKLNFTRPAGESLHLQQLPRFRGNAQHLIEEHAARGLDIDHQTCEPAWEGYDMDYSVALCGLLAADGLPV